MSSATRGADERPEVPCNSSRTHALSGPRGVAGARLRNRSLLRRSRAFGPRSAIGVTSFTRAGFEVSVRLPRYRAGQKVVVVTLGRHARVPFWVATDHASHLVGVHFVRSRQYSRQGL